jgi:PAS domain S-box-containing protein
METHEAVMVEMPPPGSMSPSGSETPRDLTAFLVLPVSLNGEPVGVLCVYSGHSDPFGPEEKALLGSLAIDLAHGVSSLRFSQERLMAQAALMESERRFREVLSGAHLLALIVDSMGHVQYCNDALLTLLDRSSGEVLGKEWFESFIAEGVREGSRARFLAALARGESPRRREDALVAAGGARRLVSWSSTVLMGADGQAVGVASLGDDITERRQVEEEREATLTLLRLATTSKDLHDLAHKATHFLRRTSGCELVAVRFRVGDDFPFLERVNPRDQPDRGPAPSIAAPGVGTEAARPVPSCLCQQVMRGSADTEKLGLTEHGSLWANSRQYLRDRGPEATEDWCQRCQATITPYESVALIPLRSAEGPLGLLQFSDRRQGLFSRGRLRLLESLADSMAMALAQREMQQALLEGEARLKVALDRARSLSVHLNSVREEQNARIAREVHDELGQHLTGLKMGLSWLLQRLPSEQESERASLLGLVDLVNGTIESVRRIARELRPAALDDLGLVPALRAHLRDFQQRTGLTCQLRATPEEVNLAPDVATALFRIAQEALTNAARHSQGTVVVVSLSVGKRGLSMSIRDNGVGISPDRMEGSSSFGLLSMKERVLAVGGTLSVSGRDGEGTRVLVTIPAAGESGGAAQAKGTGTHG